MIALSNKKITAAISEHGAELHSLLHDGFEYVWQADSKYWGRHAPILFPIVGRVYNNEYRVGDRRYTLPQHGFARDHDFQLVNATDTEATFKLQSAADTFSVYPYGFDLYVTYTLSDSRLTVAYAVRNTDTIDIYFQIGGHPAFNLPNYPSSRGHLQLSKAGVPLTEITVKRPNASGYVTEHQQHFHLTDGILPITSDLFDNGALILEDDQCDTIRMMNGNGTTHLTLALSKESLSTCGELVEPLSKSLISIWSPEHKNAPFVCIEPWLGRADDEGYTGDFKDRPFMNHLAVGEQFQFEYTIAI